MKRVLQKDVVDELSKYVLSDAFTAGEVDKEAITARAESLADDARGAELRGIWEGFARDLGVRPGEMVRYFVTARDSAGHTSRWPLYNDLRNSPQYAGTMVAAHE